MAAKEKRDILSLFGEADTDSGLTNDEFKIVRYAAEDGLTPAETANKLNTWTSSVSYILSLPHIQLAIRQIHEGRLQSQLARKSMNSLNAIFDDEKAGHRIKLEASKFVLDRIGVGRGLSGDKQDTETLGFDPETPLTEMNLQELQSFIAAGNSALGIMRRPVEKPVEPYIEGETEDESDLV